MTNKLKEEAEKRESIRSDVRDALDMTAFDSLAAIADRAERARMPALAARLRECAAAEDAANRAYNAVAKLVDA